MQATTWQLAASWEQAVVKWERWDSDIEWFGVVIQPSRIIRYDVLILHILQHFTLPEYVQCDTSISCVFGQIISTSHGYHGLANNPTSALRHADPRPILHEALEVGSDG